MKFKDKIYKKCGILRVDRYIITRFLGTFGFMLLLILLIILVIDIQEKLEQLLNPQLSLREIIDYYIALLPYFGVLLAPLFTFLTVVFFTSKLAARSELIAMQAAGLSFDRIMRPYMISAAIIAGCSFLLTSEVVPILNRTRIDFTNTWVSNKKVEMDENIQTAVAPGVIAFFGSFDSRENLGYKFSLQQFKNNTLVSQLTADRISFDSLYHWTVYDYNIRTFKGLKEENVTGSELDTMLLLSPSDLLISIEDGEVLVTHDLWKYIKAQQKRGVGNIQNFEVELHRRFASIPAAFILTLIGASLSFRKVKGGMGLNLAIGLALAFIYIFLYTVSSAYAISGAMSPMVAAWFANIVFTPIAIFYYLKVRN